MRIYGWGSIMLCQHSDKSGDHKHRDSENVFNLSRTSPDHMFKGLCEFMGGSLLRQATTLSCLVAIGLVQMEI